MSINWRIIQKVLVNLHYGMPFRLKKERARATSTDQEGYLWHNATWEKQIANKIIEWF